MSCGIVHPVRGLSRPLLCVRPASVGAKAHRASAPLALLLTLGALTLLPGAASAQTTRALPHVGQSAKLATNASEQRSITAPGSVTFNVTWTSRAGSSGTEKVEGIGR